MKITDTLVGRRKIMVGSPEGIQCEPSLFPPEEPLDWEIEEMSMEEEELLKQWEWYEYENSAETS